MSARVYVLETEGFYKGFYRFGEDGFGVSYNHALRRWTWVAFLGGRMSIEKWGPLHCFTREEAVATAQAVLEAAR